MADDPSNSLISSIGGALGGLFGVGASLASTQAGIGAVGDITNTGASQVAPYNFTGANYLAPVANELVGSGSGEVGQGRINAPSPIDFEDFASHYNMSEGAKYLLDTASAAQDNTASSRGGLLSGANLRAQTQIAEGIANTDMLGQYDASLKGQQQDFAQREQSYQNLYGQETMGLNAGTAEAGTYAQGARAIGSLYGTQAQTTGSAASSFGSALGNVFSSLGKVFGI